LATLVVNKLSGGTKIAADKALDALSVDDGEQKVGVDIVRLALQDARSVAAC
jgi:hypothetical protein